MTLSPEAIPQTVLPLAGSPPSPYLCHGQQDPGAEGDDGTDHTQKPEDDEDPRGLYPPQPIILD